VKWRVARPGLAWGTLRLAGTGEAWRIRAIVVSIDPRRFRLRLDAAVGDDGRAGPWTVDDAPRDAALALNAGQFTSDGGPWGWVVHEGREIRPPGSGPLAPAIVVDGAGAVRFVPPREIAALRNGGAPVAASSSVVEAFQSYPTLLEGDGDVPAPLADTGRGLDLAHRDSRLAIGETRDGNLLVVITRFEGLGGTLESLPFGITVPETAALMGALGARQAVMLDGGLSGQLLIRPSPSATPLAWRGLRRVALGLVAVARQ
jgi:exopolysaccharide biosynthesis protein